MLRVMRKIIALYAQIKGNADFDLCVEIFRVMRGNRVIAALRAAGLGSEGHLFLTTERWPAGRQALPFEFAR